MFGGLVMPNLLRSIEKLEAANMAKVAKPQESRALEVANDESSTAKDERALATASQAEICVDTSKSNKFLRFSQFSHLLQNEMTFLNETPFNLRMIEEGLRLWEQPFDEQDLADIKSGVLNKRSAIDYLFLWKTDCPRHYLVLSKRALRCN